MTEHRTHDIWNDDDSEEERRQKGRHPVRHFFTFLLILLAVLAVVLAAAWRDGTGFDAILRRFAYGSAQTSGGSVSFTYEAAADNRFALLGDGLAVLSGTELRVLDGQGRQVCSIPVAMENPALTAAGDRAVAYDVGGTELYVVDQSGTELLHLTADPVETYISASLNGKGWLAVTAEKKGYKGSVRVYSDKLEEPVFAYNSSQRFVTGACVTEDCKSMAAVTLGQSSSVFVSNIVLYDLNAEQPKADYNIRDGLVLELREKAGQLAALSDTGLTFATTAGEAEETYGFGGWYLREYDLSGDGYSVLLLNRYQSGSVGKLVTVGDDGREIASLDIREGVLSVSAAGRYVAVLYVDKLMIYNPELQEYASLTDTGYAKSALVREDGSALLLSSESARLFLP